MRRYSYVGPLEVRRRWADFPGGKQILTAADLGRLTRSEPMTFVVDELGVLRVADRSSEHVACACGGDVLSAGELVAVRTSRGVVRITEISNQSTGYCPEPESWPAVARALETTGVVYPGAFTYEAIFRRCTRCGQRNLVKDGCFECAVCGEELSPTWNFG